MVGFVSKIELPTPLGLALATDPVANAAMVMKRSLLKYMLATCKMTGQCRLTLLL